MHSASKDDLDSTSHCSSTSSSSTACTPRLVPGHRMWADKNGRHVLGLIEDYNALRKQISEGQQVLAEMEIPLREVTGTKLQEPGIKVKQWKLLKDGEFYVEAPYVYVTEAENEVPGAAGICITLTGHLSSDSPSLI